MRGSSERDARPWPSTSTSDLGERAAERVAQRRAGDAARHRTATSRPAASAASPARISRKRSAEKVENVVKPPSTPMARPVLTSFENQSPVAIRRPSRNEPVTLMPTVSHGSAVGLHRPAEPVARQRAERTAHDDEHDGHARGSASTRRTQAVRLGCSSTGRFSTSTVWNESVSSGSQPRRPYLRNGNAAQSAAESSSPKRKGPAGEHVLEEVQRAAHLVLPARARARRPARRVDRVGRDLPHAVEPVDEHEHACALGRVGRVERRLGVVLVDPAHDVHRLGQHLPVLGHQHGNERLAAHPFHLGAVRRVDVEPFGRQALVAECQSHPLDVGRVGVAVDLHRSFRLKIAKLPTAVASRRPSSWRTSLRSAAPVRLRRSTTLVQITSPSVAVCT